MKPSISRDVHYVSYGTPKGEYSSVCRAAKVTEVLSETRVALVVFNPTGLFFNEAEHDPDEKTGGTWHWPERVE